MGGAWAGLVGTAPAGAGPRGVPRCGSASSAQRADQVLRTAVEFRPCAKESSQRFTCTSCYDLHTRSGSIFISGLETEKPKHRKAGDPPSSPLRPGPVPSPPLEPGASPLSSPPHPALRGEPSTCSLVPGTWIWVSPPPSPCPDHSFTFAAARLTHPPRARMAQQGPPLRLETRRRGSGADVSEGQWFVAQVAGQQVRGVSRVL